MSLNHLTNDTLIDAKLKSVISNSVTANSIISTTIIATKLESNLSLSNSFEASTTAATFDPVAVNGVQSLYNGVIAVKTAGTTCAITMPNASTLNTVISGTPLDTLSFTLDLYNLNTGTCAISLTSALGVFNWKTGAGGVITFPNTMAHVQLTFIRTAVGSFWTVYY